MNLPVNSLLQRGKYKIVRFVSSGGFGCTYEAEHVMLHKRLAIKEFFVKDYCNRDEITGNVTVGIKNKMALVSRLKEKFVEEAVVLSQMNHANIVKVVDVFEENGTAYYVMDYIKGESLHELVKKKGALPENEALAYICQVANALGYVHGQNRLHLDVKPSNIMVDGSGTAILIDFGVSKQYDVVDGENTSTLLGKTPGYAPIEQMGNSVQRFTPATDIYALGATFYKLLTGITPPESTVIVNDGIPELSTSISASTRKAIRASLEFRRRDRPQTITEFLSMLSDRGEPLQVSSSRTDEIKVEEYSGSFGYGDEGTCVEFGDERAVDLGLSVKWSNVNWGAEKFWQSGELVGWGDVTGKENVQILDLYPKGNLPSCISGSRFDVVRKEWGNLWRFPTKEEQDELRKECSFVLTTEHGVSGYKVIARNGNNIFLPFTGYRIGDSVLERFGMGCYWSGTLHKANAETAYYLFLTGSIFDWRNGKRFLGMAIRPVCDSKTL